MTHASPEVAGRDDLIDPTLIMLLSQSSTFELSRKGVGRSLMQSILSSTDEGGAGRSTN